MKRLSFVVALFASVSFAQPASADDLDKVGREAARAGKQIAGEYNRVTNRKDFVEVRQNVEAEAKRFWSKAKAEYSRVKEKN